MNRCAMAAGIFVLFPSVGCAEDPLTALVIPTDATPSELPPKDSWGVVLKDSLRIDAPPSNLDMGPGPDGTEVDGATVDGTMGDAGDATVVDAADAADAIGDGDAADSDAADSETTGTPTDLATLLPWLEARTYAAWDSESETHPSGIHFGPVRTWLSPSLISSLKSPGASHPAGATAVKELYDNAGDIAGWAVSVKTQSDSAAGLGWYWMEQYKGTTYADGVGASACTGCHSSGTDFIQSNDFWSDAP